MSSYEHLGFPFQPGEAPPDDEELETWPEENVETFEEPKPKSKSTARKSSKKD